LFSPIPIAYSGFVAEPGGIAAGRNSLHLLLDGATQNSPSQQSDRQAVPEGW